MKLVFAERNERVRTGQSFLLIAALLLAACSRSGPIATPGETRQPTRTPAAILPPSPTPAPTEVVTQGTISIWHAWDEPELPVLDQILKDFGLMYPDVFFDVTYVPIESLLPRFETAVQEGGGPAILLGPAHWGPPLYDAGLLADLSNLAGADLLRSLNQAGLGTAQYQDALIGLPYTLQGVVLYRNRSIIPEVPATFEDLVSLARSTTVGEVIGADLERSFFFSGAHLESIGGVLMQPDGAPAFTGEKGLAWVRLLQSFEQAGATEFLSDRDLEEFSQGRVGFIIDGTWNRNALREAIGEDNIAIDPWPAYEDGRLSGYVQSDNLYLSSRASGDTLLAAEKFIEFFLSPEAQLKLAEIERIPAARDVGVLDPLLAQAIAALAGGTAYPSRPEMEFYPSRMDVALKSVFEQGAPPAEALQSAMDDILAAMMGIQATPAP